MKAYNFLQVVQGELTEAVVTYGKDTESYATAWEQRRLETVTLLNVLKNLQKKPWFSTLVVDDL